MMMMTNDNLDLAQDLARQVQVSRSWFHCPALESWSGYNCIILLLVLMYYNRIQVDALYYLLFYVPHIAVSYMCLCVWLLMCTKYYQYTTK